MATLEEQRRMRPSIARLIRDTIYPNLQVGAPSPPSSTSSRVPSVAPFIRDTVYPNLQRGRGSVTPCESLDP